MSKEYVELRDGGYLVKGTRISLDSVVYAFLRGESPEGIADSFPALQREEIFGALAFYMANRDIVNQYLADGRREFDAFARTVAAEPSGTLCKACRSTENDQSAERMRPRFLADADLNQKIVTRLRRREPAH